MLLLVAGDKALGLCGAYTADGWLTGLGLGLGGETHTYLLKRPFWVITPLMFLGFCLQFITLGLMAELQARTYHESQNKPIYVIRETAASSRRGG
jgi:hypothetical protein